jgi:hypothetical protein
VQVDCNDKHEQKASDSIERTLEIDSKVAYVRSSQFLKEDLKIISIPLLITTYVPDPKYRITLVPTRDSKKSPTKNKMKMFRIQLIEDSTLVRMTRLKERGNF